MRFWAAALLFLGAGLAEAQPKRILYVTHSAGYRHASIPVSQQVMEQVAARTGRLAVTSTEDLSVLTADKLRDFDAVFFFTSGELALSNQQKQDLLAFVRSGKGFGGAHSATDTLYSWADYGEMIGAYFDGHPWVQEARIDVEDPESPMVAHLGSSWSITEEFYQFRAFSRDRVRVLMTLDTESIDLKKDGVNRTDRDFALAWVREFGQGRVFYTALGHFDETWQDARFQKTLEQAMLWLTGQIDALAAVRTRSAPSLREPVLEIAPGGVKEILGAGLTSGSTLAAPVLDWPVRLVGSRIEVAGVDARFYYASPSQVNVQWPVNLPAGNQPWTWVIGDRRFEMGSVRVVAADPQIRAVVDAGRGAFTMYAVGLGATVEAVPEGSPAPRNRIIATRETPRVMVNDAPAELLFSGLAPGWVGLYQVNALWPAATPTGEVEIAIEIAGRRASFRFTR
jgi:type 1 glutamine amidotransferase